MTDKTVCFTGHRKIPDNQLKRIAVRLDKTVERLILSGYCNFAAGGALGFDTMAAECVLKFKKIYPRIKLILLLPCLNQTKNWRDEDIAVYEKIKNQADKVLYISEEYTKGCMFRRNRRLVDCSSLCVAYMTHTGGGTAYSVNYARRKNIEIINPADEI